MKYLAVLYLILYMALLGFDFASPTEEVLMLVGLVVGIITMALLALAAIFYLIDY